MANDGVEIAADLLQPADHLGLTGQVRGLAERHSGGEDDLHDVVEHSRPRGIVGPLGPRIVTSLRIGWSGMAGTR
ncbi:MAG: hypothetical protein JWM34_1493 [Ilumatobacteraceae bacterium]|nr:hypothetical protein [Ilumatobacteraceae bacterium]